MNRLVNFSLEVNALPPAPFPVTFELGTKDSSLIRVGVSHNGVLGDTNSLLFVGVSMQRLSEIKFMKQQSF